MTVPSFIALLTLVLFLISGKSILQGFQISIPALSISGAVILFLVALRMIFSSHPGKENIEKNQEPFIVPLAIPLLAGPSTIAIIMLFASREPHALTKLSLSLLAAWTISTIILLLSNKVSALLGKSALAAVEKLMGMILITLAIQMFIDAIIQIAKIM